MENIRIVLELLYFCSGITIAILGFIGLKQLKIAKDNTNVITEIARTSARREAIRLAAEQCAFYYAHIIPMFNEFDKWVKENNFQEVIGTLSIAVTTEGVRIVPKTATSAKNYLDNILNHEATPQYIVLCNGLEGFAVLFTSGRLPP